MATHTRAHNCRREENNTKTIIVRLDLRPRITMVFELSPRRFTYALCKHKRRLANAHIICMGTRFNPTCQKYYYYYYMVVVTDVATYCYCCYRVVLLLLLLLLSSISVLIWSGYEVRGITHKNIMYLLICETPVRSISTSIEYCIFVWLIPSQIHLCNILL